MRQVRRWTLGVVVFGLMLGCSAPAIAAQTTLVPLNATWKYLDDGSNQGTAWRASTFDDSAWAAGPAELGYGDDDEATVVSFGSNSNSKHITTYFRHSFTVADPSVFSSTTLRLRRDDGAIVYLNGVEVVRSNMPGGSVSYTTTASSTLSGADESALSSTPVDPALLAAGTNTLAVEIHQRSGSSSDISFALDLVGSDSAVTVTRGPYLQSGSSSSVIVRWRTGSGTDSRVRYGTDPANLNQIADDGAVTTEHGVTLSGLASNTTYYYSVGTTTSELVGGDLDHFFITPPAAGTAKATRLWVIGDSGTADANARAVRDAFLGFTASTHTDLWLMLGDNAYNDGTDSQYQAAVFDMYPSLLRKSVVWPTLGNHDGISANSSTQSGPYYDIFQLPTQGEAGGVPSGTEAYYSFDYGNIHFICLDSHDSDRSTNGAMLTWLVDDLLATTADWVIAFWHHPPYTKGSHNSDNESRLIDMRQNALPILEDHGVDVVLSGHSHSYERSFLIDSHYGSSSTFGSSNLLDGGDGRVGSDGAYQKPTLGMAAHEGAVYAVAGSSGKISGGSLNHPAMHISLNSLGSVVLDIDGDTLTGRFLDETGAARDEFSIVKGADPPVCGDGTCDSSETTCSCAADCGAPPLDEIVGATCTDNIDNDCDLVTDCDDPGCATEPLCICAPKGDSCTVDSDCCSGKCRGPSGRKSCK